MTDIDPQYEPITGREHGELDHTEDDYGSVREQDGAPADDVDWRTIFAKYLACVGDHEGVTFLAHVVTFTEAERRAAEALEATGEWEQWSRLTEHGYPIER